MKIVISNKIYCPIRSLPKKLLRRIISDLSFDNPQYQYHKSKSHWYILRSTDKYITGYDVREDILAIDRSYSNVLLAYLNKYNVDYQLVLRTHTRRTNWFNGIPPIKLWVYQEEATRALLKHDNGILKMPCGSGKTITLLEIIRQLQQYTLVLVHTSDLLHQWRDYIEDLWGKEPGIIQGDNLSIKPITIATVQTLSNRILHNKFRKLWGMVVTDEIHHTPSVTFSTLLNMFSAKYRYGASATLYRSDRLEGLIFAVCGFPCYQIDINKLEDLGYVIKPKVQVVETNVVGSGRIGYTKIINNLVNSVKRNKIILDTLKRNSDNYNLVLSIRIKHLQYLYKQYKKFDGRCAIVTSKVDKYKRAEILQLMREGKIHTIFATQLADEGLDIPILNRLYLTLPTKSKGKVEQRIGRIQRKATNKIDAIVYDFVDSAIPLCLNHYNERLELYKILDLEVMDKIYEFAKISQKGIRTKAQGKKDSYFKRKIRKFVDRES